MQHAAPRGITLCVVWAVREAAGSACWCGERRIHAPGVRRARGRSRCKPGSVPRTRCRARGDGHPSGPAVADGLERPTRTLGRAALVTRPVRPCTGWGLPSRPRHRGRWWSLTPPFHPHRRARGAEAVCSLLHWPAGLPGWTLSTILLCGARTFLAPARRRARGRPRLRPGAPVYAPGARRLAGARLPRSA